MKELARTLTDERLLIQMSIIKESINDAVKLMELNPSMDFCIANSYQNLNVLRTEFLNRHSINILRTLYLNRHSN